MSDLPPGFVLDTKPTDTGLPDGFVLDAPRVSTPVVASEKIAQPVVASGPTPVAEPSWGEYFGGMLDQAGRNLVEGAIDLGGVPHQLAEMGSNVTSWGLKKAGVDPVTAEVISRLNPALAAPDTEPLKAGLDNLNNATADVLGVERPRTEPENVGERYAAKMANFLGGAMVPVGGGIQVARRVGVDGARELPAIARMFVEPAAVAPVKFARKEANSALAFGGGAATANEWTDPNSLSGQLAELFGGFSGLALANVGRTIGASAKSYFWRGNGQPKIG